MVMMKMDGDSEQLAFKPIYISHSLKLEAEAGAELLMMVTSVQK